MTLDKGNPEAPLMIVGDSPPNRNIEKFLHDMLAEAGILSGMWYRTVIFDGTSYPDSVSRRFHFPPSQKKADELMGKGLQWYGNFLTDRDILSNIERLHKEIEAVKPKVILALGDEAMATLTGEQGIYRWRGSILSYLKAPDKSTKTPVVVTLNPEQVIFDPQTRSTVVTDLRRVRYLMDKQTIDPVGDKWNIIIRPSFNSVIQVMDNILLGLEEGTHDWVDFDLETKAGHIACAGLSWSSTEALCIPLMCEGDFNGYWTLEEETQVVYKLYELLTHPKVKVRGQNLLYDCQYTYRHWHWVPMVVQDTMISHHTCFPGLKKSLDYQASLYCDDYRQWKPEKEVWKDGG